MSDDKLKIIQFKKEPHVRADVVDALESMLARAKKGEVLGVYAAILLVDDEVATVFSHANDYFRAVGTIELLKQRVLESV